MAEENNLYTFENPEYRKTYWHTSSHIMAQAVKRLWPEVQLAIGPAIDEGWYYDFDAPFSFTPDHLTKIEAEMKKIVKERIRLERSEKSREEAIAWAEAHSRHSRTNNTRLFECRIHQCIKFNSCNFIIISK